MSPFASWVSDILCFPEIVRAEASTTVPETPSNTESATTKIDAHDDIEEAESQESETSNGMSRTLLSRVHSLVEIQVPHQLICWRFFNTYLGAMSQDQTDQVGQANDVSDDAERLSEQQNPDTEQEEDSDADVAAHKNDKEEEAEEAEAEAEEEEDEDEDEEPEDIKPKLEEECAASKPCAPLKHHFDECQERVLKQLEDGNKHGHQEDWYTHTSCINAN